MPEFKPDTLIALRSGNVGAFEIMLLAYERGVFSYLARLVGNRDDAADLTQETFLKVYRKRQSLDPSKNFKSWLYTIATNTAYDWLRKKRHFTTISLETEEAETNPSFPAYSLNEEGLDVRKALQNIRPVYRSALLLFYREGLSYEEISAALDLPVGTVKTHLSRGKAELKKVLHGYPG